jgi:hypothetical protein
VPDGDMLRLPEVELELMREATGVEHAGSHLCSSLVGRDCRMQIGWPGIGVANTPTTSPCAYIGLSASGMVNVCAVCTQKGRSESFEPRKTGVRLGTRSDVVGTSAPNLNNIH